MSGSRQLRRRLEAAQRRGRPQEQRVATRLAVVLRKARTGSTLGWVAALALIAGGTTALILVLTGGTKPTVDGGRYLAFTECLLTDSRGLSAQPATAAWAGMQRAASATKMQAQYLQVPQTARDATPYLASLVVRHCGVIVAAGPAQVAAVRADAARYQAVRFLVVGGAATGDNVTTVNGAATSIASEVDAQATAALHKSG